MPSDKPFLTTEEAAARIGVSAELFEDLASREDWLAPYNIGQGKRPVLRWDPEDVEALVRIIKGRSRQQKNQPAE